MSLSADGERIELRTEIDNHAMDHRMRAHFPVGETRGLARESLAGGTFGAVRRPIQPVAAPREVPRPVSLELGEEQPAVTHPFTGFVACGAAGSGIAVLARGLREYQVLPAGELAVTLFRSVGWLSRGDLASRRGNAGPDVPTPGAQEIGSHAFHYALVTFRGDPDESNLSREWEEYRVAPRVVVRASSSSSPGDGESVLEISDEDLIFSSLRGTPGGAFSLRLFDSAGAAREASIRFSLPVLWARKTRIDGTAIRALSLRASADGVVAQVPVTPWEIVTVEFGGNR